MRPLLKRILICCSICCLGSSRLQGQVESPDPQAVQACIDRTIEYLYSVQEEDHWPEWNIGRSYRGATTALAVLALTSAGESPEKPQIARALRYIERFPQDDERTVYGVSLRVLALAAADPTYKKYTRIIQSDADWLIKNQCTAEPVKGGWDYVEASWTADASNSQFALLALHEAVQAGAKVEMPTWDLAEVYWQRAASFRGGFGYKRGDDPTGSMTCAGISSLMIVFENRVDPLSFLLNGSVNCCQPTQVPERVLRGISWLASNFRVTSNPAGGVATKYYYLYGLERAARLTGQRFIGDHDWYRVGAGHLLTQQNRNGSFSANELRKDIIDTSFALLFLSKGLRPILFGKYQYTESSNEWDLHPEGIHFLTRETEKAWNLPMTWQTIRAKEATANDLREAPILYIAGREKLILTEQQKKALKDYVENGGFIFAEAYQGDGCGDAVPFDTSFRELMAELFPDAPFEPLGAEHPVWTANYLIKPNPGWPVYGLQTCCRTGVIYVSRNLTGYWRLDRPAFLDKFPANVSEQIVELRKFGVNVAAYATGRELLQRLSRPKLVDREVTVLKNRVLNYPKLQHAGGADDAPNAWKNILLEFAGQTQFTIDMEKKVIPVNFAEMANYPLLFLHGRNALGFSAEERQAIKKYLENGNLLFIDSICSSAEFNQSIEEELEKIFPGGLKPIPANHPIWQATYGHDLKTVTLRTPDFQAPQGYVEQKTAPQLKGIEIEGRWAVVFSPYDLSCAMENASANQCQGYAKEDAAKIAVNVLLYALLVD